MDSQPAEVLYPPRLVARRREVRRARVVRIRRVAILVATLAGMAYGGWAIAHSRLFALDGVRVTGAVHVSRDELMAAGGIRLGMNLLSIDTPTIERRLEQLPVVASARVERLYPSRLRLIVTERIAVGALSLPTETWLFDSAGIAIASTTAPARGLAPVKLSAATPIVPGKILSVPGLEAAVSIWQQLPAALRSRTSYIDVSEPDSILLLLGSTRVVLGDASDLAVKLAAVQEILHGAGARRVYRIDVSAPTRPAARIG